MPRKGLSLVLLLVLALLGASNPITDASDKRPPPRPTKTVRPPHPLPTVTLPPTLMPTTTPSLTPLPTTPPRSIAWGAYIVGSPWDMSRQDAFEAQVGKRATNIHLGIAWYTYFGPSNGYLPVSTLESIRLRGATPVVSWFSAGRGNETPDRSNAAITRGDHDAYIRDVARTARTWGYPFILRFDSEMNGDWWGYSEGVNGNAPGSFVPMWKHVHDIFAQEGATNVTWAWIPNVLGAYNQYPFASLFPGEGYVDIVGADGYNWGGGDWQSFAQVFDSSYRELRRLAPNRAIMIGETASDEAGDGGTRKADWIRDLLTVQVPQNYPAVVSFNWYNINDGKPWPVDSSQPALDAFRQGIALSIYRTP